MHTCELATVVLQAGRARLGGQAAAFTDPDSLADALLDAGCRQVQALDMQQHRGHISSASPGSEAQVRAEEMEEGALGRVHRSAGRGQPVAAPRRKVAASALHQC